MHLKTLITCLPLAGTLACNSPSPEYSTTISLVDTLTLSQEVKEVSETSLPTSVFVSRALPQKDSLNSSLIEILADLTPETIIQRPMNELIEKEYHNPLVMRGVRRNLGELLGYTQVDSILTKYPLKRENLTATSQYLLEDTLTFPLIVPSLASAFPLSLEEQLQEEGFRYTGKDSLQLIENTLPYVIVVKAIGGNTHALAVYKNGQLLLATHISIGGSNGRTLRGLRRIDQHFAYKRSLKYDNVPMPYALHIVGGSGGYYLHQGRVTGKPLSH
ncbi:MAG: L,D-transpeptidase [Candidatus Peribacteria bacterium]|jgi:hypothetical protein|nr:L,D-transpeptidase [Candidatus Peribacteria bacterium]